MQNLTQKALTQQIYESKCAHPSLEDILNCFYELRCSELASLFDDLASVIHQAWHSEHLEVSEIEALDAEQSAADSSADAGY